MANTEHFEYVQSIIKQETILMQRCLKRNEIIKSFKHATNFLLFLRNSVWSLEQYYKIQSLCIESLSPLSKYLLLKNKTMDLDLVEVYDYTQYIGNVIPRLYLMITVGICLLQCKDVPYYEILKDLTEMTRCEQHPIRGLFVRYYLYNGTKNQLIKSHYIIENCSFILSNFEEMNKLWVRLQHIGSFDEKRLRLKQRNQLKIMVSSQLVEIKAILIDQHIDNDDETNKEKLNKSLDIYKKTVLPRILNNIIQSHDPFSQEYLFEALFQIFPSNYHRSTLESLLSSTLNLLPSTPIGRIVSKLIVTLNLQGNGAKPQENECITKGLEKVSIEEKSKKSIAKDTNILSDSDGQEIFQIFWSYLHTINEKELNISLHQYITLLESIIQLVVTSLPNKLKNLSTLFKIFVMIFSGDILVKDDKNVIKNDVISLLAFENIKFSSLSEKSSLIINLLIYSDPYRTIITNSVDDGNPLYNRQLLNLLLSKIVLSNNFSIFDEQYKTENSNIDTSQKLGVILTIFTPLLKDLPKPEITLSKDKIVKKVEPVSSKLNHLPTNEQDQQSNKTIGEQLKEFDRTSRPSSQDDSINHRTNSHPPKQEVTHSSTLGKDSTLKSYSKNTNVTHLKDNGPHSKSNTHANNIASSQQLVQDRKILRDQMNILQFQKHIYFKMEEQENITKMFNTLIPIEDLLKNHDVDDIEKILKLILTFRNWYFKGGENIKFTYPILITNLWRIIRQCYILNFETINDKDEESSADPQFIKIINQTFKYTARFLNELAKISLSTNNPEIADLSFKLNLQTALLADQMKYSEISYDFLSQSFSIFEEALGSSKLEYQSLVYLTQTLHRTRSLYEESRYESLIIRCTLHASKLLKKQEQCRALYYCSHLWWPTKLNFFDEVQEYDIVNPENNLNKKRIMECLQRSLRLADSLMDNIQSCQLMLELLNQCLYYFETDALHETEVRTNYINGLIDLIKTNVRALEMERSLGENETSANNTTKGQTHDIVCGIDGTVIEISQQDLAAINTTPTTNPTSSQENNHVPKDVTEHSQVPIDGFKRICAYIAGKRAYDGRYAAIKV
ncbi:hypothetical protein TBLA_0A06270 [Henningerozyma blattae CBS 6284]|uniref:Vacuolar protein sorting-associated protein 35 n=1 Tax=Henningerozyma blattae (strain ATCC 34711 / CBS 6284 / DSM 70876 / NBRC 10599 / NRRL Y-10934 / UCD 77-7) TaxID=1071380 RepID=I2GWB6_HENB6|nr:hypothetical protein TBLA_0A06270 [Tetrapisispora blattae CBS 6284]CCH58418.1 hypothetical protein TBLA_0A06270 [Tetrapisispora blattae CBS 6284]